MSQAPHQWSREEEKRLAAEAKKYRDPTPHWKEIAATMLAVPKPVRAYDTSMCRNKWRRMKEKGDPLVGRVQKRKKAEEKDKGVVAATPGRGLNHSSGGHWTGYNGLSVDAARPPPGMTHAEAAAAANRTRAGEQVGVPAGRDSIVSAARPGHATADGEGEDDDMNKKRPTQFELWRAAWFARLAREKEKNGKDGGEVVVAGGMDEDMPELPDTIAQPAEVSGENAETDNFVPFGGGAQVEDVPLFPNINVVDEELIGNGEDERCARLAAEILARAAAAEGVTQEHWEGYLHSIGVAPPGYKSGNDWLDIAIAWGQYHRDRRPY